MLSARTSTPRGPGEAWRTPRDGPGTGDCSLKAAARAVVVHGACDPAPGVRAAGKALDPAADCLILPTPRTPEGLGDLIQRHRQRTKPGEMSVHWGLRDIEIPPPGPGYGGKKNKQAESVHSTFRATMRVGVAEYLATCGEGIYQSTSREPLGRTYVRGHVLPKLTQEPTFPGFGCMTARCPPSKESMFPRGVQPDSAEAKALYRRTHGSYDTGEMLKRDYKWPSGVDADEFRFGMREKHPDSNRHGLGAKTALNVDCGKDGQTAPAPTVLADLSVEHFRLATSDRLGKSRGLLQGGTRNLPEDHTYGKLSGADPTSAGELIRGFYTQEERLPDGDLGRCTHRGRRNFLTKDPLGVPTVRTDKVAPPMELRSVASATNYGDDADASTLIYPGRFQFKGVVDGDFRTRRPAEELRKLMSGAGYELPDALFDRIVQAALEFHGDGGSEASLEMVASAYAQLDGPPPSR